MSQTASKVVKAARDQARLTTLDYIDQIIDDFVLLHGDRLFADDAAIVGGVGRLAGKPVTVIGTQKGKNFQDNLNRNFGQPHPEGYRKALRLMKQAEKFNRPVILFVNTAGAYPGLGAEERGQGEAIARNLFEMSELRVPIISIITGEGGSGGALALAVADQVWMMTNSMYSILSPEGFATILWKDGSRSSEAAELMKLTAHDLLELKVIDRIIEDEAIDSLKASLIDTLDRLRAQSVDDLIAARYARFRKY